jgi:hypothetical protein
MAANDDRIHATSDLTLAQPARSRDSRDITTRSRSRDITLARSRSRSRSHSRDAPERQPRKAASRGGRFAGTNANSVPASTTPSFEWLNDAHAYRTITQELAVVKRTYPATKTSLQGGNRGATHDAWKRSLRAEGRKLMRQVKLAKRHCSNPLSDTISESHVHTASENMRITRLPIDDVDIVLRPSPGITLAEMRSARFLVPRVKYPNHPNNQLDWVQWARVTGMEKTKLFRLACAEFGREMTVSPGAQRVFVLHLRCFIEAIVPVFAQYARENGAGRRGTMVNVQLIERTVQSTFTF